MRAWACFETKPARRWETLLVKISDAMCITSGVALHCHNNNNNSLQWEWECVSRGPRFVPQRHLGAALGSPRQRSDVEIYRSGRGVREARWACATSTSRARRDDGCYTLLSLVHLDRVCTRPPQEFTIGFARPGNIQFPPGPGVVGPEKLRCCVPGFQGTDCMCLRCPRIYPRALAALLSSDEGDTATSFLCPASSVP